MEEQASTTHEPVMIQEIIEHLDPHEGGVYCDGTAGGGGHARALLEASSPTGTLIALDRDPEAVARVGRALAGYGDRAQVIHAPFSSIPVILNESCGGQVDGLLLDLGVSSFQLDNHARGFSFKGAGPLDMRMDTTSGETAAELLKNMDDADLAQIIREYGEERYARRVARAVVSAARQDALETTEDLARVVRRAVGPTKAGDIDSATRTFQAIRIAVNDEIGQLRAVLARLPSLLREGGRAAFISFHSIEDRAVKQGLRHWSGCRCRPRDPVCSCGGALLREVTRKPLRPSEEEIARNVRSRSAKLRVCERLPEAEAA